MRDVLASDTEYRVVRSETSVDVDGFRKGELTGEIESMECGQSHLNIDEITYKKDCPQRWVKTDYWRNRFLEQ